MRAEIISIGSEITSGQNLDTNSQWLSQQLAAIGIPVLYHTTVADDQAANVDVFRLASQRAELVIATGGLGPTQDDLTRSVLAEVAGVELVFDAHAMAAIQAFFASRGRPMPERNRLQAFFPAGAEVLDNAHGTAPGIWMRLNQAWVAALPGVPREMHAMFRDSVLPRIQPWNPGGGVQIQRKINCFGAGESAVEEKLLDLTRRGHVPEVGITASGAIISLRILARATSMEDAWKQIRPVEATIRERLGDLVYGEETEDLEDVVLRLLEQKRQTIATAESVTAGQIAARLARIPGASQFFLGGVVVYSNESKSKLLQVPPELIEQHGAVSQEVVECLARNCRELFGTDLAIAIVGLAGPGGATPEKPLGLVHIALATPRQMEHLRVTWSGDRQEVQSRASRSALNLVRLHLQRLG